MTENNASEARLRDQVHRELGRILLQSVRMMGEIEKDHLNHGAERTEMDVRERGLEAFSILEDLFRASSEICGDPVFPSGNHLPLPLHILCLIMIEPNNKYRYLDVIIRAEAAALTRVLQSDGMTLERADTEIVEMLKNAGIQKPRGGGYYTEDGVREWRKSAKGERPGRLKGGEFQPLARDQTAEIQTLYNELKKNLVSAGVLDRQEHQRRLLEAMAIRLRGFAFQRR